MVSKFVIQYAPYKAANVSYDQINTDPFDKSDLRSCNNSFVYDNEANDKNGVQNPYSYAFR